MRIEQEPKYDVTEQGRLVNRASGQPIPDDEPVFIFRARDLFAASALNAYLRALCAADSEMIGHDHRHAIRNRVRDFERFAQQNPHRMKIPDTAPA